MKHLLTSVSAAPSSERHPDPSGPGLALRDRPGHQASAEPAPTDSAAADPTPPDIGWVVVIDEQGRHCLWPACEPLPPDCRLSDGLDPALS